MARQKSKIICTCIYKGAWKTKALDKIHISFHNEATRENRS